MHDEHQRSLTVRRLGTMDYTECLALQHQLVEERAQGLIDDVLLLVEHPPVITLGRRKTGTQNVLFAGDVPVVSVERGGDVTWHGPGQLVGYPILALRQDERDLHRVLRQLEQAHIAVLAGLGLDAGRKPQHTGVWCQGRKLVSLGVAVVKWVTFHGFALNVDCDLTAFQRINPCGLSSQVMGSIQSLGAPIPEDLAQRVAEAVTRAFGRVLVSDGQAAAGVDALEGGGLVG